VPANPGMFFITWCAGFVMVVEMDVRYHAIIIK